jgi:hypothetical protein
MAKCSVGLYGVWLVESKGFIDRDRWNRTVVLGKIIDLKEFSVCVDSAMELSFYIELVLNNKFNC